MSWLSAFRNLFGGRKASFGSVFIRDLTADAEAGHFDPVIGRDEEIDRVIHIIARRTKNNPLLIGEAGVGKTAVVEGLAQRIARNQVPPALQGKRLYALNLADLLSGTGYRGELEQRLSGLTSQLEGMRGKIVLFVDELHMIHQAKGAQGGLNLSDMLKPALARGEIAIIGATTWHEYEGSLKSDPAIERRFQPVLVGEPSRDIAIAILKGLASEYEMHHGVRIEDDAIAAAVDLSRELIKDRFLPDKAIDLMDEAASKVSIEASLGHRAPMGVIDKAAHDAADRIIKERQALKGEVGHLGALQKEYPQDPAIIAAAQELNEHVRQLDEAERAAAAQGAVPIVTAKDVQGVIGEWRRYYEEHREGR